MRRYQEVKVVANPAGFPVVNISDKCSMAIGGTPLRSNNEYYENGHHIWVSVRELNNGIITDSTEYINDLGVKKSNVKLVKKGSVLMSFKLSIGKCAIAGVDLYTNEAIVAFNTHDESILLNKYLYYYLSTYDFSESGKGSLGHGSMNKGSLSELQIPLPPLSVQQEIVSTLDRIYSPGTVELSETLKLTQRAMDLVLAQPNGTMLEPIVEAQRMIRKSAQMAADVRAQMAADVRAQMAAIVKSIDCRRFPVVKLGDIVVIESGKYITKSDAVKEGFPIYGGGDACDYYSSTSNRNNRLIIAKDGISLKCVRWVSCQFHLNHHGWTLKCNESILEKYLYYYLCTNQQLIYNMATGSAQKGINQKIMEQFEVTLPPLDFQQAVLTRLDALQSQLDSLDSLSKQAEDNARFILESYLG